MRLILATRDKVAVQFNGPLLRFGTRDPARSHASLLALGPDALAPRFAVGAARKRLRERGGKTLADLLLDQTFVAGVGNKYKSEILFVLGLYPFHRPRDLAPEAERALLAEIPRIAAARIPRRRTYAAAARRRSGEPLGLQALGLPPRRTAVLALRYPHPHGPTAERARHVLVPDLPAVAHRDAADPLSTSPPAVA